MNEETLTLYYYNDGLTSMERRQIANMLATDKAVATRYQSLCHQLDKLSDQDVASPPADMVERWHDSIRSTARRESFSRAKPGIHTWSFIWGAALTAAVAVGIGVGIFISDDDANQPAMYDNHAANATPKSDAFVRGLQVHFRESEQGLSALPFDATADRMILIMNIIDQNRLFEKAAQKNDSQSLARILRAFELVLVRLAAEDISAEDAEELRAKLLFELNVMLTKLSRDTSVESQTI